MLDRRDRLWLQCSGSQATVGVCTSNRGYAASLEVGKLYAVIPDTEADKHGYIRVIDESGEDYGYSAERFFLLQVPEALANALSSHAVARAGRARPSAAADRLAPTAER